MDEQLRSILQAWDRRLRLQQTSGWLSRALMLGLVVGIGIAMAARGRPWLTNDEVALAAVMALTGVVGALLLMIWLWPRQPIQAAQQFDRRFGLQERVSTALELASGRIQAAEELVSHQIDDAYRKARSVAVRERLPLIFRPFEWIAVLILVAVLVILILLPNEQATALSRNAAQDQVITEAAGDIQDAIEEVATDTNLDDETREQLLETLEASLETLQDEDISEEEALAIMSEVENALNEQAEQLESQSAMQQQAERDAAESLSNLTDEQLEAGAELSETLEQLAEEMDSQSQEDMNDLAEALQQAAEQLQEMAPEAAEALREAAEALREGDQQAAQEALQRAAEEMQRQSEQQQRNQESAEQMQQSAEQMQQAQDAMQRQSQQGQESEQGQEGQEQGEEGEAGQEPGEEGQSGQQPGEGEAEEGQTGSSGEEEGGESQTGEGQPGDNEGQQGNPEQGPPPSNPNQAGGQVGNEPPPPDTDTSGAPEQDPGQGAGDEGEEDTFESVFAPRRPNMETGDTEISLETDDSDVPVVQGDFSENPEGQVTVPYNQVYGDYAGAVNEALDQGYIPLGLRDVIHDYFTSLAPRSGE